MSMPADDCHRPALLLSPCSPLLDHAASAGGTEGGGGHSAGGGRAQHTPPTDAEVDGFYEGCPVLVTGGAGFIGSHLTQGLVARGAKVRVVDDLSEGRLDNLAPVANQIEFVQASILDRPRLEQAMQGCAIVFHEAALASVPASVADPVRYNDVNVTGTLQVLEASRACKVHRIAFASSSAVYGDLPELPKRENQHPDPVSPYAQEKLTGEHMLNVWWRSYGLSAISLRYFNIFGPSQRPDSAYAAVVAAFASALLGGRQPRIFGDGTATRDFTYVDNVVQANLRAGMIGLARKGGGLERREEIVRAVSGRAYNIACGKRITVTELAEVMIRIVGAKVSPKMEPPRAGDVQHSVADITLARETLGYRPTVTFEEGMRRTLDWYRTQYAAEVAGR